MNNIYSNAFNFEEFLETGVDPRTGQFTVCFNVLNIMANQLSGPDVNIPLSYSSFTQVNYGFGTGWQLGLTRYEQRNRLFVLSTGESYKVKSEESEYHFKDKKLRNFKVIQSGSDLRVIHKDGTQELLSFLYGGDIAYVTQIASPEGRKVYFEYDQLLDSYWCLTQVSDDTGTLLMVEYTEGVLATVSAFPNTGQSRVTSVNQVGGRLQSFYLPNDDELCYDIDYFQPAGQPYFYINQFRHPTGAIEQLTYQNNALGIPGGGQLPAVSSYQMIPGGEQPACAKSHYSFSSNNFLGNNSLNDWSDGEDNLYLVIGEYDYSSVETITDEDSRSRIITRTYNKFHLLVSEVNEKGQTKQEKHIQYHSEPNTDFYEQPAICQLPKKVIQRFTDNSTDASHEVETGYKFDDYGNQLEEIGPTGIKTLSSYYEADGEEGCPADLNGMVSRLKAQTIVPSDTQSGEDDVTLSCSYQAFDTLEGNSQCLLRVEEVLSNGLERQFAYHQDDTNPVSYARLAEVIENLEGKATKQTLEYTFNQAQQRCTHDEQFVGFDGATKQVSHQYSSVTGQLVAYTDPDDVTTEVSYDDLQRVTKAKTAPGTEFEADVTYVYTMGDDNNTITHTNAKGVKYRLDYDNNGRVIKEKVQDGDGNWKLVKSLQYNELDQCIAEVEQDWDHDKQLLTLTTEYDYDDWGNQVLVRHPDGTESYSGGDPVSRIEMKGLVGLHYQHIHYNDADLEVQNVIYDSDDKEYSHTEKYYDGHLRLVTEVNCFGKKSHYLYDKFDRVIQVEAPDQQIINAEFASFRPEALQSKVWANDILLGSRDFDGLGRLLSEQKGNKKTSYRYAGRATKPDCITLPNGTEQLFGYNVQLRTVEQLEVVDDESVSEFTYDAISGLCTGSKLSKQSNQYTYNNIGQLTERQQKVDGESKKAVRHYSQLGRLLEMTDYLDNAEDYQYDEFGRLVQVNYSDAKSKPLAILTLDYDSFSRMSQIQYQSSDETQCVTTSIGYDRLGRESSRLIAATGVDEIEITLSYNKANQLIEKKRQVGGKNVLAEQYEYDDAGRLLLYTCQGEAAPQDTYGNTLSREVYTFDDCSNLSQVKRKFSDGSENIAAFEFADEDPTAATAVTNTHTDYPSKITLAYDDNGNLLVDQKKYQYAYNRQGQLIAVRDPKGKILAEYQYDADGELSMISNADGKSISLLRLEEQLLNEIEQHGERSYHRLGGTTLGGLVKVDDEEEHVAVLAGTDRTPLAMVNKDGSKAQSFSLSPYGDSDAAPNTLQALLPVGFNGERLDMATGLYHLGAGYRSYQPGLMRFMAQDEISLFGEGGINGYAYCHGNPVNLRDPNGQFILASLLGLIAGSATIAASASMAGSTLAVGLGIASGIATITQSALYIAAGLTEGETSERLSKAGLAFGAISFALSLGRGKAAARSSGRYVVTPESKPPKSFSKAVKRSKAGFQSEMPKNNSRAKAAFKKVGDVSGFNAELIFTSDFGRIANKVADYAGYGSLFLAIIPTGDDQDSAQQGQDSDTAGKSASDSPQGPLSSLQQSSMMPVTVVGQDEPITTLDVRKLNFFD